MTLEVVPISRGTAGLGAWGTLELTGAMSAVLRPTWSENIYLPEAVAGDLTSGVVLLNDDEGKLLFLPYAAELVVAYDLRVGEPICRPMAIPRDEDRGMRMAAVRLVPRLGVVYLTETVLACFSEDCVVAWRHDEDFAGWVIEGVTNDDVLLVIGDWAGNEQRQARSLATGRRTVDNL